MSTTTSPHGPSPNLSASPYDLTGTPSSEDESWQYLDYSSSASVGFLPSPASGSLNGYAVVGHAQMPAAESPLYLDLDQPFPAGSMSGGSASGGMGASLGGASGSLDGGASGSMSGGVGEGGFESVGENAGAGQFGPFLTPQDLLLTDEQLNGEVPGPSAECVDANTGAQIWASSTTSITLCPSQTG